MDEQGTLTRIGSDTTNLPCSCAAWARKHIPADGGRSPERLPGDR